MATNYYQLAQEHKQEALAWEAHADKYDNHSSRDDWDYYVEKANYHWKQHNELMKEWEDVQFNVMKRINAQVDTEVYTIKSLTNQIELLSKEFGD